MSGRGVEESWGQMEGGQHSVSSNFRAIVALMVDVFIFTIRQKGIAHPAQKLEILYRFVPLWFSLTLFFTYFELAARPLGIFICPRENTMG